MKTHSSANCRSASANISLCRAHCRARELPRQVEVVPFRRHLQRRETGAQPVSEEGGESTGRSAGAAGGAEGTAIGPPPHRTSRGWCEDLGLLLGANSYADSGEGQRKERGKSCDRGGSFEIASFEITTVGDCGGIGWLRRTERIVSALRASRFDRLFLRQGGAPRELPCLLSQLVAS